MRINLDIPPERLSAVFSSLMCGNDPVTRGWVRKVSVATRKKFKGRWWYTDPGFFARTFALDVTEDDDGDVRHHRIDQRKVQRGIEVLARDFPHKFVDLLDESRVDAPLADILLQCVVFGEEKYA